MPTDEKVLTATATTDPELEAAAKEAAAALDAPEASPPTDEPQPERVRTEVYRSQEELEARDRHILAALDEMLERRTPQPVRKPPVQHPDESGIEKFVLGMVRKGAGIVSLAMTLIFMGIVVMYCFFSEAADMLLPLKLSPIAAILLGLELFVYHLASGKKFRIHIPAIIINALLVAGCCTMAVIMSRTYVESKQEYSNRSIAAEIYESGYHELRHAAEIKDIQVTVDLNPDGNALEEGLESLGTDDTVILTVTFSGAYESAKDFARECKTVIDAYKFLDIPVTRFHFISDNKFTCCRLDIEGKFMQDLTETELTAAVNCVFVDDYGYVSDLEDIIIEETVEILVTTEI
ncbi:MAG: hypothetical protein E7478_02345 [Ruminococcaceae bacterium]|nr:hypothetical protein [Oscillospiraceae bacterium]